MQPVDFIRIKKLVKVQIIMSSESMRIELQLRGRGRIQDYPLQKVQEPAGAPAGSIICRFKKSEKEDFDYHRMQRESTNQQNIGNTDVF